MSLWASLNLRFLIMAENTCPASWAILRFNKIRDLKMLYKLCSAEP